MDVRYFQGHTHVAAYCSGGPLDRPVWAQVQEVDPAKLDQYGPDRIKVDGDDTQYEPVAFDAEPGEPWAGSEEHEFPRRILPAALLKALDEVIVMWVNKDWKPID